MSIRTIIEINHDAAGDIDRNRYEFCNLLHHALRNDDVYSWENLRSRFGLVRLPSDRSSDDLAERARDLLVKQPDTTGGGE